MVFGIESIGTPQETIMAIKMYRLIRRYRTFFQIIRWLALIVGALNLGPIVVMRQVASIHTVLFAGCMVVFVYLDMRLRRRL
ncbi:MAG: hypothetical protein GF313_12835 [Caldithrix sp.]|nr:hypothetical protein [Caldithrix sp.]